MKKLIVIAVVASAFVVGCKGSDDGADNTPPPKGTVPATIGKAPTPPDRGDVGDGR